MEPKNVSNGLIHVVASPLGRLTFIGRQSRGGTYVLHIHLIEPVTLTCGGVYGGKGPSGVS
jgi:hypothetical protein